jgi:N-acetylated-alpha-linked acidic dipeptidase
VNYPLGHRLALLEKGKKSNQTNEDDSAAAASWKVKYEATLKEDVLEDDPTTGSPDSIPTFHGYSASGNVTAQYVYVNYGTYGDFEDLVNANVSLKGKIALIKYGRIFRGLKVKRAQDLGMIGAIIYSDPGDDGTVSPENGNKTYPDGPARNPSSVQRGSAQFLCKCICTYQFYNQKANAVKQYLLATQPPLAILLCQESQDSQPMGPLPLFLPSQYPTLMHYLC